MRELSIEEKAKRYDEAIERAKDFMNVKVHYTLKKGENIMCWIFPELKESEDERIRNRIINYLKLDLKEYPAREKRINEMLAYLEKQGKSNMGISEATKQELENNLNKALENEAPEKIYLPYKDDRLIGLVKTEGVKFNSGVDGHIEYIRKDAFVEKVARFLEYKLNDRVEIQVPGTLIPSLTDKKTFIEDVKEYMKGE